MDIKTRRSIRKYAKKDVTEEMITRLLSTAEHTQTMGNLQLYSVVETREGRMKEALSAAHFSQPMVCEAPVVLTFCADFRRTTVWAENRSAEPGYNNLLSFINGMTDALLYCQTFCNLAEEEGLGLCFLGTTIYQPKEIIRILRLPRLVMPVATITVGYPDEHPEQTDRLPVDYLIHKETYHDYSSEDLDVCYAYKESLPESQTYIAENHKQTLAQVFTDVRYKKSDNECMSDGLLETLRKQGFLK